MKRKIAVVTGTRADYGLLYWIMKEIESDDDLELQIIATGAHLCPDFDNTYKIIESDGFSINKKIDMLVSSDKPVATSKSMGLGIIGLAQAYDELKPDILLVLGDRFEVLAAVSAAIPFNICIAHIHGGETTEGAIDDQIRHAITKASHIHFASTSSYADNIIKMGEEDGRVFNVGAPGLEWLNHVKLLDITELSNKLEVSFENDVILATFHPVTLEQENSEQYIDNLLSAIIEINLQTIFTGVNSDPSGSVITNKIKSAAVHMPQIHYFTNLGQLLYLSCQKHCSVMVGNSSSGIIESASLGLPVVNIGNRQAGRAQSGNVINVQYGKDEIKQAIQEAIKMKKENRLKGLKNIYGDGKVSSKVVDALKTVDISEAKRKKLVF